MAKVLESELVNSYLLSQGLRLGLGNGLEAISPQGGPVAGKFCTGKSVYELVNFSNHVAGWLRSGSWKLLQIDDSSYFYPDQESLLSALLVGPTQQVDLTKHRTFLFEFGAGKRSDFQTEVVIAHLTNLMLIYEAHCYFLSSGGGEGEMIAVQDGVVYFFGNDVRLAQARKLLEDFDADPNRSARWINSSD